MKDLVHVLRQKELDVERVRKEIAAFRVEENFRDFRSALALSAVSSFVRV